MQRPSSRRDFLSQTSAVGIGAALTASIAAPSAVHAGADETIKIALIGCGGRGAGAVAQALSTEGPVKLWAVADAFSDRIDTTMQSLEKLPKVKDRVDVAPERRFVGLDAYRKAIDSGVDLVIIAAPPGYRPQHFEYAVGAGKNVFMEKPVATDAPGVRRLLESNKEAKKKNLKVGVGLQRHHDPIYVDLVKRLQDGVVGDLTLYRAYWDTAAPGKKPVSREGLTELEYQLRNWYWFAWLSGDHICEQHIHNIDVCNWIQGAYPVTAQGKGGRQVRTGKEYGNIFDHHVVEFTYANGAKMFSQCRQIPGCLNNIAEFAHGTKGWCDVSGGELNVKGQEVLKLRTRGRQRGVQAGDRTNPFQIEHDDLMAAIRGNKPYNEVEYGAYSTMTAIMGRMATWSGQEIEWDEALASSIQLTTDAEDFASAAPVSRDKDGYYAIAVPGISKVV
jgi:predicted dehydrogenase